MLAELENPANFNDIAGRLLTGKRLFSWLTKSQNSKAGNRHGSKINYRLRVEAFNCMSDAELYDQEIYDLECL